MCYVNLSISIKIRGKEMNVYSCRDIDDEYVSLNVLVNREDLLNSAPKACIKIVDSNYGVDKDVVLKVSLNSDELGELISQLTLIKTIMDSWKNL